MTNAARARVRGTLPRGPPAFLPSPRAHFTHWLVSYCTDKHRKLKCSEGNARVVHTGGAERAERPRRSAETRQKALEG